MDNFSGLSSTLANFIPGPDNQQAASLNTAAAKNAAFGERSVSVLDHGDLQHDNLKIDPRSGGVGGVGDVGDVGDVLFKDLAKRLITPSELDDMYSNSVNKLEEFSEMVFLSDMDKTKISALLTRHQINRLKNPDVLAMEAIYHKNLKKHTTAFIQEIYNLANNSKLDQSYRNHICLMAIAIYNFLDENGHKTIAHTMQYSITDVYSVPLSALYFLRLGQSLLYSSVNDPIGTLKGYEFPVKQGELSFQDLKLLGNLRLCVIADQVHTNMQEDKTTSEPVMTITRACHPGDIVSIYHQINTFRQRSELKDLLANPFSESIAIHHALSQLETALSEEDYACVSDTLWQHHCHSIQNKIGKKLF